MNPIYLLIAVPGSGKSWVANQLTHFEYIPHDDHKTGYLEAILKRAETANKPLLVETPFSISKLRDPLIAAKFNVIPVFIIESVEVTKERYLAREGKEIPKGHLTRIETYKERAKELNAFSGTSYEVLQFMNSISKPKNILDF